MSEDIARLSDYLKIHVSPAIPEGEIWLQSGCGWTKSHPHEPHGEPQWRAAGMCVHEHLERALLCDGCKKLLENCHAAGGLLCETCDKMRPGSHRCPVGHVDFRPLDSGDE